MPFKKNDLNINRNGRPPRELAVADLLRSQSLEIDPETGMTKREALVRVIYDKALEGERWACEFIVDRTEGKPFQSVYFVARELDEVVEI
jgi:hypothetical protein